MLILRPRRSAIVAMRLLAVDYAQAATTAVGGSTGGCGGWEREGGEAVVIVVEATAGRGETVVPVARLFHWRLHVRLQVGDTAHGSAVAATEPALLAATSDTTVVVGCKASRRKVRWAKRLGFGLLALAYDGEDDGEETDGAQ